MCERVPRKITMKKWMHQNLKKRILRRLSLNSSKKPRKMEKVSLRKFKTIKRDHAFKAVPYKVQFKINNSVNQDQGYLNRIRKRMIKIKTTN